MPPESDPLEHPPEADGRTVRDLDPRLIDDRRIADRLERDDVFDLLDAIEEAGQTVPILVRPNPAARGRYLLVCGRRRLEAIRLSEKVGTVRAIVAHLDDTAAIRAQVSENMARRDLSFIEKALFATELVDAGFGTRAEVADMLTVTRSSVSMAFAIVEAVGPDLIRAIGPAHGVGRPRWTALGDNIELIGADRDRLIELADQTHIDLETATVHGLADPEAPAPSVQAFEAVEAALARPRPAPAPAASRRDPVRSRGLTLGGEPAGRIRRSSAGLRVELTESSFVRWLNIRIDQVIADLHARWQETNEE